MPDQLDPFHLLEAGPTDGPPMVLVHGLGGASINWQMVVPLFAEHGFSVAAPDLIGHGRTPRMGRTATIEANLGFLDAFVRSRGEPVVLVGNSMGGLLAMMQAARAPETVASLVLVAPAVPRFTGTFNLVAAMAVAPALMRSAPIFRARARRQTPEGFVDQNLRFCVKDISRIDPAQLEAHVELATMRAADPDAVPSFVEASSSMIRVLGARRFEDTVRAVRTPTLIVGGAHDRLVPLRALERTRALRPDWAMHVFEHCAHVPQMEDPSAFVDLVTAWLGDRDDTGTTGAELGAS
jgi:pimeloyl-ACP methyl ester carboxylesterase